MDQWLNVPVDQAIQAAVQHHHGGRLPQAEGIYRQILARQPNHVDALHLYGIVAHQTGRYELSAELIGRALAVNPGFAAAHANLGNAQQALGNSGSAMASYRRAIALDPNIAEAYANLGNVLKDAGSFDEAIACHRKAIALEPTAFQPVYNLGVALQANGELNGAALAYRNSIALEPGFPEAHNNLAVVLRDIGQLDEAVAAACAAVALRPAYVDAHINLGNALRSTGRGDEAIAEYERAIAIDPESAEAHRSLGIALLSSGDLDRGWREYEWRLRCNDVPTQKFAQPMWDGAALSGRTILIHAEQGFGDAIQFIRYIPLVVGRGGKVVIACSLELQRLFVPFAGEHPIVSTGNPLPHFQVHCPLLSLPGIFATTLDSIPGSVPYLFQDPDLVKSWQSDPQLVAPAFRVGLAWAGNPTFTDDRSRSLTLDQLVPLVNVDNATFFSLQKGYAAAQADHPPAGMQLVNLSSRLNDFANTAAVMSAMDLIVTTDTSIAHLAGALGRPVWVMLQFAPDWRWMTGRDDCRWYPTMRLFRQPSPGDWPAVIEDVRQALANRIASMGPSPSAKARAYP